MLVPLLSASIAHGMSAAVSQILSKLPKLKPMLGDGWRVLLLGESAVSLPFSLCLLPLQRVSRLLVLLTVVVWMQRANRERRAPVELEQRGKRVGDFRERDQ
jgi:hypothetical protein